MHKFVAFTTPEDSSPKAQKIDVILRHEPDEGVQILTFSIKSILIISSRLRLQIVIGQFLSGFHSNVFF